MPITHVFRIATLIACLPLLSIAQKKGSNQFDVGIGTHFYKKKPVQTTMSQPYLVVKNTVGNSLYLNYKRVTKNNLLLLAGVEAGYERFKGNINYPFEKHGFYKPVVLGEQYQMDVTTVYARLNIAAGYRFKVKGLPIDVLAGMLFQFPVTQEQQYFVSQEDIAWPYIGRNYNFHRRASWGKDYDMGFVFEKITFIQIGTTIKKMLPGYRYDELNIGIRVQQNYISPKNPLNIVGIRYYDHFGNHLGNDMFLDNQFAISLMLGVPL